MNLSQHLTVQEFIDSDTADRLGIDNSIPPGLLATAQQTAIMFEKVRAVLCVPVLVTSGYRCPALNQAIGSSASSDHLKALAIDFKAPGFGKPLDICKALKPKMQELGIGQMIFEHTWVHISTRAPANKVNAVLTLAGKGYLPGIVTA